MFFSLCSVRRATDSFPLQWGYRGSFVSLTQDLAKTSTKTRFSPVVKRQGAKQGKTHNPLEIRRFTETRNRFIPLENRDSRRDSSVRVILESGSFFSFSVFVLLFPSFFPLFFLFQRENCLATVVQNWGAISLIWIVPFVIDKGHELCACTGHSILRGIFIRSHWLLNDLSSKKLLLLKLIRFASRVVLGQVFRWKTNAFVESLPCNSIV